MIKFICSLCLLCLGFSVTASDQVIGTTVEFSSPRGIKEQCIALTHMPGGIYTDQDRHIEKKYCSMDIYSNTGLCPKTWSTSPGTMFYPLAGSKYKSIAQFENSVCKNQKHIPIKSIAFKNTMNEQSTSGTFSTASLLYYHFSRYFNTQIQVPVAVYRSIDENEHRHRVSQRGLNNTHGNSMIHNAWKVMLHIESSPSSYYPVNEVFTRDKKQIYGVLLRSTGKRYNAVVNGTRQSGWGEGQNRDFEETPAFWALRSQKPLVHAVTDGMNKARNNHTMSKAMGHKLTKEQVVFWMQDLTEITLMDYIFSQQDRIGNIDYTKTWVSENSGMLQRSKKHTFSGKKALQIKQTHLNDNDAGGRYSYANFSKKTGMLEKTHHYNVNTYLQLMKLHKDFSQQGKLYQYLDRTFGLSKKQRDMIVKNTKMAAEIIQSHCHSGQLIFDLEPEQFFLHGSVEPVNQSCEL